MPYCVAYGCTNSTSRNKNADLKLGFFGFPKNKALRKAWIHAMRRKNFEPSMHSKVCSMHFNEEDFERYPPKLAENGYPGASWKLKDGAVPSKVNVNPSLNQETSARRASYEKRRRKEVVNSVLEAAKGVAPEEIPSVDSEVNVADICTEAIEEGMQAAAQEQTERMTIVNSRYVQTLPLKLPPAKPITNSQSSQTDIGGIDMKLILVPETEHESSSYSESDSSDDDSSDEYTPEDEEEESDTSSESDSEAVLGEDGNPFAKKEPNKDRAFIVYESCLKELLAHCLVSGCSSVSSVRLVKTVGSMGVFKAQCLIGHTREWQTQPVNGKMPWGNLLLSAGILFSGTSISKFSTFCNHASIQCFSTRTYHRLQEAYLIPAISDVWNREKETNLQSRRGKLITIGGDGRCDSPGHTAKYCSYTIIDLEKNIVLDTQIIQSNEESSSNAMELAGLKKCRATLDEASIEVDALVTDRHVQVKKYMKEQWKEAHHYFDVWHVTKGVNKKLLQAGAKKGAEELKPWIKSIVNHMYWVASSSGENQSIKTEKWRSIMSHVCNIHDGFDGEFTQCAHGVMDEDRAWLKEGSRPYKLLSEVILSPYLLRDIPKLSPRLQTYGLEVFHSVLLNFAPKHTHYFYKSMKARIELAALHFNENGNKKQASTVDGVKRWSVCYPKKKKGEEAVVKKVKVASTYGYVEKLMGEVCNRRKRFQNHEQAAEDARVNYAAAPQPITAGFKKFEKSALLMTKHSRFPQPQDECQMSTQQ